VKKILAVATVAAAALVLPATAASADTGACRAGTDAIEVPYAWTADNTPLLAGTVCVRSGGTTFDSMTVAAGWRGELNSDGSKGRTEVRFTNTATKGRVDLRYEAGRTEIKS
jgi:hypothetical protein